MRRLDRRRAIAFIDVTRENAGCPIDRSTLMARFHAQEANGPIVSGAAAFAAMWRAIPILRPFGLAARNRMMLRAMNRAYAVFLRLRPFLSARLAGS